MRFLLLAGIGWTDNHQPAVIAGIALVGAVGIALLRVVG
jgi:hypothetical protein